jgi:hypothetical protein
MEKSTAVMSLIMCHEVYSSARQSAVTALDDLKYLQAVQLGHARASVDLKDAHAVELRDLLKRLAELAIEGHNVVVERTQRFGVCASTHAP